jgi:predicted restriction endonuclease
MIGFMWIFEGSIFRKPESRKKVHRQYASNVAYRL